MVFRNFAGRRLVVGAAVGSLAVSGFVALAPAGAAPSPAPIPVSARYTATMVVPDGIIPTPLRFGGISGIDNVGGGNYVAVSDDKGDYGPARFYRFGLPITPQGTFASAIPAFNGGGTVLSSGNLPLLPGQMDLEGIRRIGGDLIVSSEGARPFIRQITPLGLYVREIGLPRAFTPGPRHGLDSNRGLEGLSVTPGGSVVAMTEWALKQDGGGPTTAAGTRSRLLITGAKGTSQYVYRTDPLSPRASKGTDNGVSEVLAVNATEFLVLERGYDPATRRNSVKIYIATTRGATNVNGVDTLSGRETPMAKRLVFDFAPLMLLRPDNVEGMTFGPMLEGKRRSLVLISDDNFNNPAQHTKIHLLALRF
ncbi:esterase-like activity of phytase family protein [Williamsia sp. CHRR-6]|uniref:esterase-like activity of phytase family protein n=1 Tax=Williamsia sp. CHRR-6 TaxID=2835871 RepID=UPI001BD9F6E1|nr:esterase-like activity of phytase family protein [Williamsia sp. CHRR-6]MBT0567485.1 esterase-like activity of phytase family protein [Williamsia sp. CHRR-6]